MWGGSERGGGKTACIACWGTMQSLLQWPPSSSSLWPCHHQSHLYMQEMPPQAMDLHWEEFYWGWVGTNFLLGPFPKRAGRAKQGRDKGGDGSNEAGARERWQQPEKSSEPRSTYPVDHTSIFQSVRPAESPVDFWISKFISAAAVVQQLSPWTICTPIAGWHKLTKASEGPKPVKNRLKNEKQRIFTTFLFKLGI